MARCTSISYSLPFKDRIEILDLRDRPKSKKRKQRPDSESTHLMPFNSMKENATRRLRRKLNPESHINIIRPSTTKRDLILLHFNTKNLHSPAPSAFRRMERSCVVGPYDSEPYAFNRKTSYPPESYISITAHGRNAVAQGAVGTVYKALVSIEIPGGIRHRLNMVVKVGTGSEKERMAYEYEAYKCLAEREITDGIIGVHGIFHDMETGTMIILIEDAGISLRARALAHGETIEWIGERQAVQTSEEERDAFLRILKGIQTANFNHSDLRIDNLMNNADGDAFIVDFDRADDMMLGHYMYVDTCEMLAAIGWPGYGNDEGEEDESECEDDGLEDG